MHDVQLLLVLLSRGMHLQERGQDGFRYGILQRLRDMRQRVPSRCHQDGEVRRMVKKVVTGNYAAAYGAMRARVRTVAAYPITPQTFIVEHISEFVNNGEMDCAYMERETDHSAMSACVSASATGVGTFTD